MDRDAHRVVKVGNGGHNQGSQSILQRVETFPSNLSLAAERSFLVVFFVLTSQGTMVVYSICIRVKRDTHHTQTPHTDTSDEEPWTNPIGGLPNF